VRESQPSAKQNPRTCVRGTPQPGSIFMSYPLYAKVLGPSTEAGNLAHPPEADLQLRDSAGLSPASPLATRASGQRATSVGVRYSVVNRAAILPPHRDLVKNSHPFLLWRALMEVQGDLHAGVQGAAPPAGGLGVSPKVSKTFLGGWVGTKTSLHRPGVTIRFVILSEAKACPERSRRESGPTRCSARSPNRTSNQRLATSD